MSYQETERDRKGSVPALGSQSCNPELGAELKWNSAADQYNQWDTLGQDEKIELIAQFISANAKEDRTQAGDARP